MKSKLFKLGIVLFSLSTGLMAQKVNEGVYLSSNDFSNGKISYANNQSKKYKLHINEIFSPSTVKIIIGDSIVKLSKDSIFGYRDKKNTCYRFYNKAEYKIINPTEKNLLYSKPTIVVGPKNSHTVTTYFFSADANSPIYLLTMENREKVLHNDVSFHEILDVYAHNDSMQVAYDSNHKIYYMKRVDEIRKQKANKISNN